MKRFMNFRASVVISICYLLGIFAFYLFSKSLTIPAILMMIIPVIITGIFFTILKNKRKFILVFSLACQVVLLLAFLNVSLRANSIYVDGVEENCVVTARYIGYEKAYDNYIYFFDRGEFIAKGKAYKGEQFEIKTSKNLNFIYGDVVRFQALISSQDMLSESGVVSVDYLCGDYRFLVFPDYTTLTVIGSRLTIFDYLRLPLETTIRKGMGEDEASVLLAMMFGDKSNIQSEIEASVQFAGIAHIFAVSGLHVGVVAGAISLLLYLLNVNRWPSCIISIFITGLYCGMCNFSPSASRALLMFSAYKITSTAGLKYDRLNGIFLSALIILIINPAELFNLGFILSYVSVLSIVLCSGQIARTLSFLPENVSQNLGVVLSVQFGTLPVTTMVFGYIPLTSIIINFILIPVISVVFVFGLLSVFFATFTSWTPLLYGINFCVASIIDFVVGIDFASLTYAWNTVLIAVIVFYTGFVLSSDIVNMKFGKKLTAFTLSSILFIGISQLFMAGIL